MWQQQIQTLFIAPPIGEGMVNTVMSLDRNINIIVYFLNSLFLGFTAADESTLISLCYE